MPRRVITLRRQAEDLLAGQLDAAARRHQAGDRVAQRGLAHAVAADDGEHAASSVKRHALQRMGAAVVDVEVLDREHRAGRRAMQAISACRPCRSPAPRRRSRSRPGVPCLQHAAVVHHGHALDHAQRDVEVVLDQHEAHVRAAATSSSATSSRALGRRQARGRLVEQDQARRAGQRHADLELALLAVRQVGDDRLVGDVRAGATRSSRSCVATATRGRARAAEAEAAAGDAAHREEQVVAHRQVAEQQRGLVGAPQALADALVGRQRGDVLAEEADPARRWAGSRR